MMMSERRRNWSLFTGTQREEFQLQSLIYQYLITGMSIPLQLIFTIKTSLNDHLTSSSTVTQHHHSNEMTPPFCRPCLDIFKTRPVVTTTSPSLETLIIVLNLLVSAAGWSCYQMGHGRKLDPEPGRCRRTDGKKWRCSKEAGPDSKYCDRHKHRSKKRSRKHVESMEMADSSKGRNTIQASLRIPTHKQKLILDSSFSLCSSPDNSFRYGHWKNEEVDNNDHVFLSNAGYGKGKGYSSSLLDDSWQLKEKSLLGFTSKEQCLQFEGLNKPSKHCQSQMFLGTEKDVKNPKKVMHHFI